MVRASDILPASDEIAFKGRIDGVFILPVEKGILALSLTEIEGTPQVGQVVRFQDYQSVIVELGKNSTDGKPVSTRSCLTGRSVSPYGSIAINWAEPRPDGLIGVWLTGTGPSHVH